MNIEKFDLLDEIYEISEDLRILKGKGHIPKDSTILENHFPGKQIFPGVLQIEMMAQSSGFLTLAKLDFNKMAILATVSRCKFSRPVYPGSVLHCSVSNVSLARGFSLNEVTINDQVDVVCEAEIRLKVVDFLTDRTKESIVRRFWDLNRLAFSRKDLCDV